MEKQKKKKVIIIGDSMIKIIDGYLLTSSINYKYLVKVRPFLAAKSVDMLDYAKPIKRDLDPEAYVIHIGTNNLGTDKTPDEIFSEILCLIKELKTEKNKIVVSTNVTKFLRHNNNPFMTKDLRKQIMVRSKLRNIFNKKVTMKTGVNISVNAIFA